MNEKQRRTEKNEMKQQEFMVMLEKKYRDVCERVGISASINFKPAEESANGARSPQQGQNGKPVNLLDDVHARSLPNIKNRLTPRTFKKGEGERKTTEMTQDQFQQLQEQLVVLTNSKKSLERKYKGEISQLTSKITELEAERQEISKQLKEKEQENNILQAKYNELKRNSKGKTITPLEISPEKPGNDKKRPANKKFEKGNDWEESMKQSSKKITEVANNNESRLSSERRLAGVENTTMNFDDKKLLKGDSPVKISKLMFYYSNEYVCGVQATYRLANGETVEGEHHVHRKEKYLAKTLVIEPDDYICLINGFYTAKGIQHIHIETAKGTKTDIGNANKPGDTEEFKLPIGPGEHLNILVGGFRKLKTGTILQYYSQD